MSEDYNDTEYEDDGKASNDAISSVSKEFESASTETEKSRHSILNWIGNKRKVPLVHFSVANVLVGAPRDELESIQKYHMTFKFVKTETRIVRKVLTAHGLKEAHPHSNNVNILWSGGHFRPYTIRGLQDFQKANHFPRSFELTRKDKLYRNIQRMQQCKGQRHFDFIPGFFVLPSERSDFHNAFLKDRGPWIVKPVASSRGRGIYLIKDLSMIPTDEQVLVCRYIQNPLLVDGFKFDCRIYVVLTSFDPLTVYMYKEGLARFSTVKYEKNFNNIRNLWMHLTNYSIQKNNENYVKCDDPEVDNFGSKWSFSALLRHLKSKGVDTKALMGRIEDVIVKTMISVEFSVGTACRMFVPYKNCCFELFGFDILIDEDLKPWLLEVNLSPSLACESPLDLKIKANLITDLFNLTGVIAKDPVTVKPGKRRSSFSSHGVLQRYRSLSTNNSDVRTVQSSGDARRTPNDGFSNEELRMIREAKEEYKRRGKFVRIYPTPESWELYGPIQEHSSNRNKTLHCGLFPELWSANHQRPLSAKYMARARSFTKAAHQYQSEVQPKETAHGMIFHSRYQVYEKKLDSWEQCLGTEKKVSKNGDPKTAEAKISTYERDLLKTKKESKSDLDLSKVIVDGDCLSKMQAREAFAAYLERVQTRLLQEISASSQRQALNMYSSDVKQDDQMNLILRFLKRAAVNFRYPMAIISPAKSLPLQDKQKMLVRQLKEFIYTYRKETLYLLENDKLNNRKDVAEDPAKQTISNDTFHLFITVASEVELEELLSVFTKNNKAASIFLGELDERRPNQQSSTGQRQPVTKITKDQALPRSSWKELLSRRESNLEPSIAKYDQPVMAFKSYGSAVSAGLKQRPVSAILTGQASSQLQHRPASATVKSIQGQILNQKSKQTESRRHPDPVIKGDTPVVDQKLNNESTRHSSRVRHSSAPLKSTAQSDVTMQNTEKRNRALKSKAVSSSSDDADKTFESFVNYEAIYMKDGSDDNCNLDGVPQSSATHESERRMRDEERETYFRSRESRRIDSAVKKAQQAYYETYLKELQHNTKAMVPHPPSQPVRPDIRKPVNTTRINRFMAKSKDKEQSLN